MEIQMTLSFYMNLLNNSLEEFIDTKETILLNNVTSLNTSYSHYSSDILGVIFLRNLLNDQVFAKQHAITEFFIDKNTFFDAECPDDIKADFTHKTSFWHIKSINAVIFCSNRIEGRDFIPIFVKAIKNHSLANSLIVIEDNFDPNLLENDERELASKRITEKEEEIKENILNRNVSYYYIEPCDFVNSSNKDFSNTIFKKTTILDLIALIDSDFKLLHLNTFKKETEKTINKAHSIAEKGMSYFIENDKKKFGKGLLNSVFYSIYSEYNDLQRKIVYNYILFSYDSPTVLLKEFVSFNYAYKTFEHNKQFGGMDFLDLTIILVSIFKCVEILFCKFVNSEFGHISFVPNSGRRERIYLDDKDLSLGSLFKIFDTDEPEIVSFLDKQKKYSQKLENVLFDFINYSRNGFLHKDLIDTESEYHLSLRDSLNAIFLLILMFEDR